MAVVFTSVFQIRVDLTDAPHSTETPAGSIHCSRGSQACTRNSLTFVNTTAIAYTKMLRLRRTFCMYAIAVVFTNVRELRVNSRQKPGLAGVRGRLTGALHYYWLGRTRQLHNGGHFNMFASGPLLLSKIIYGALLNLT